MDTSIITQKLADFVRIPSVSTDPARLGQVHEAAHFLQSALIDLGAHVELVGDSHPLVVGLISTPNAETTIGIYGHYDVQPADPVDQWDSDPFTLTLKDGKYYGRGVADNKGHIVQNLTAIQQLITRGSLKSNIVFLFEGEEESGSVSFQSYLDLVTLSDLSTVDVWYVTDTGMRKRSTPQIYTGLRGLLYTEITMTTGTRDLHSGIYGNRVYNPANLICELLGGLKDSATGRINLPGFYDGITYPRAEEYARLLNVVESEADIRKETGQYSLPNATHHPELDEGSHLPLTLMSKILPSCDIHGISTGYTGHGAKTVIPHVASAKVSFRLVAGQDPDRIEELLRSYLVGRVPLGIRVDVQIYGKEPAFQTDITDPWMSRTALILEKAFDHPVQYNRTGGSIPAAGILQESYHRPVILTGFTLPDDHIHAPNENFDEEMFWKGIEVLEKVYKVESL